MYIESVGWIGVRALPYGGTIALYENHPAPGSLATLAALFRWCLVGFPADGDAALVGRYPAGRARLFERAILDVSGLLDDADETGADGEDAAAAEDEEFINPANEREPPPDSVMAGPAADERNAVQAELDEHREVDLVHQLHEQGYTFGPGGIYALLIPEINAIMEGAERAAERQEQRREEAERNADSNAGHGSVSANGTGPSTAQPGQGARGRSAGDELF